MIERRDGEMGDVTYVVYDEDGDVCWVPEDAMRRDAKQVAETLDRFWTSLKEVRGNKGKNFTLNTGET